ncbi:linalool dehydratase/isomerase domain-containing protein [Streptomyces sp. IBSBF 2394]|uniref:linalool dehydratase/isomerase domain-containing protein n=1 Tax=Streptomyces sp. IBSBF 2394 TaxID=2903532 RepID=UPI002FDC2FED
MAERLLTAAQTGHLRHFDNLSRQLPNDWSLMQGKGTGQDDFGGYRFQLAYMAYALALTHVHRLPAAPGLFQPTMQRLIDKILLPEVWMYWRDSSRGGAVFNAHLADSLHEEWNPVVRDNIMYSAYVQSMALLHDHLFDSDRYADPGSLTMRHWSFFWGGEEKRFAYDRDSLNEHIYWQMVQNGYLGVACEPNCVFQICNQPAILGFRLHDLLTGGMRAEEVIAGYEQAWADFGRLDDAGHYNQVILQDSKTIEPNRAPSPWVDAWCGTLMNMWNRDFVRANYPRQVSDFLVPGPDGTLAVRPANRQEVMGQRVIADNCDFGWVTAWASEMGDERTLKGLLAHADRFMNPTWRDGGLYYPRNDTVVASDGHLVEMDPLSGNVLIGYARLNVSDGLWGLYNRPWGQEHFDEPALTAVDRDVDVSQAEVVDGVLHTRLRRSQEVPGDGTVIINGIAARGRWTLAVDGRPTASVDGTTVQCEPGPFADAVRVRGEQVMLRCADTPHRFTFWQER